LTFVCVPEQQYSRFELRHWVAERRADGRAPAEGTVIVRVEHPLREADGSCRWCGEKNDETIEM
jgi:hypothetical protein